ncbi:MAG: Ig domain-containing protein, partial [Clostridia bacterium]|nr:Ig domain-containing protein [Clostridia bacterium]
DDPDIFVEIPVKVNKPVIPVDEIKVNKDKIELTEGETDKLEVTVTPDDATNKDVTFSSSDETVVKVDENGNVEAIGDGDAVITVTSKDDPDIFVEIPVKVNKPVIPVDEIKVNKDKIELTEGETDKIEVTVTPDDATNKEVTFSSSDETVVKVDKNGNIEAVGEGEAVITVTSKDKSEVSVNVTIKVSKKSTEPEEPDEPDAPDYSVIVPDSICLIVGESKSLEIQINPDDGCIVPVFKSNNENIVKIDADGKITAVAIGSATISVDLGNGDIRIINVTVLAIPDPPRKHYICFGKTDGIGWYEVSVNGGDFFPQGPNSTLEVDEGAVLVIRIQDMWIDDEFDFYVNGKRIECEEANTITVVVDGYMLIGALSMDMQVPDVEESLSLLEKIIQLFNSFINWLKSLFS